MAPSCNVVFLIFPIHTTFQSEIIKNESIKDRGVLEPLLVTQKDGNYLLLCGERRFLASQKLCLETIPVRVMDAVTQKDEILAYQLTENMQREDLNPVDQAKGFLAYVQAKHPDKGFDLDGARRMRALRTMFSRESSWATLLIWKLPESEVGCLLSVIPRRL